jgi:serine-type D-Ala-D-Ala carboxypeptidase (penicillin-binding protein 5/6)
MALQIARSDASKSAAARLRRGLIAAFVVTAVGASSLVYAANQSVQGFKKEEGGFDGDAPTAILIEATSGSVLFEKNADELRAPSSMMKLMTAEVVFHAIQQGARAALPPALQRCLRPSTARFRWTTFCTAR